MEKIRNLFLIILIGCVIAMIITMMVRSQEAIYRSDLTILQADSLLRRYEGK